MVKSKQNSNFSDEFNLPEDTFEWKKRTRSVAKFYSFGSQFNSIDILYVVGFKSWKMVSQ